MESEHKPSVGIIGAGRLGTTLARQSIKSGYHVSIANSRGPETLKLILSVLIPEAVAGTVAEVIERSDMIILAIPLSKFKTLPLSLLTGKIVIDAMNYWAPTEGHLEEFANASSSSSELVQKLLPNSDVVKTLNHVAYHELEEHALPNNDPKRRAIALAGDDDAAKKVVSSYINDLGFDPVDVGPLSAGIAFQPDTALFNARLTASEITALLNT